VTKTHRLPLALPIAESIDTHTPNVPPNHETQPRTIT